MLSCENIICRFEPQDQDDKWRVSVTDQSRSGNISIHFARSGTDKELYVLVVKPIDGGSSSGGGVKIEAMTWEQNKGEIVVIIYISSGPFKFCGIRWHLDVKL